MSKETFSVNAVILAGGVGSRMGELTANTQKCLCLIDNKPIIGHVLDALVDAFGSVDVTFCVSYKADDVREYVEKNKPNKVGTRYIYDIGHSRTSELVKSTKNLVTEEFIVTAGDVVADPIVYSTGYEQVIKDDVFASVALSPKLRQVDTHAVGRINDGRLTQLLLPPLSIPEAEHLRDMTIWGLGQNFHDFYERYPELTAVPKLLNQAILDGEYVSGNLYNGNWVHIGYPEDLTKSMKSS